MKITSKGQVTIPQEIREQMGLLPHTDVEFVIEGNNVLIKKKSGKNQVSRGKSLIAKLKGQASSKLSTEEIMSMTRG